MSTDSASLLLVSLAAALSPTPILVGVLLLLSPRGRANGAAYVVGWLIGLLLGMRILIGLLPRLDASSVGDRVPWLGPAAWVLLGILLVGVGIAAVRRKGSQPPSPANSPWADRALKAGPAASFLFGLGLAALSPKILILSAAALVIVSERGLGPGEGVTPLISYCLVATSLVALPVVAYYLQGARGEAMAEQARDWILRNQSLILGASAFALGGMLIFGGLRP